MTTTTKTPTNTVVKDLLKLADDWSKPKTLQEIYQLVGKFPFTAKAVAPAQGTLYPVGTSALCTGLTTTSEGVMTITTPDFPIITEDVIYVGLNKSVPRWVLAED